MFHIKSNFLVGGIIFLAVLLLITFRGLQFVNLEEDDGEVIQTAFKRPYVRHHKMRHKRSADDMPLGYSEDRKILEAGFKYSEGFRSSNIIQERSAENPLPEDLTIDENLKNDFNHPDVRYSGMIQKRSAYCRISQDSADDEILKTDFKQPDIQNSRIIQKRCVEDLLTVDGEISETIQKRNAEIPLFEDSTNDENFEINFKHPDARYSRMVQKRSAECKLSQDSADEILDTGFMQPDTRQYNIFQKRSAEKPQTPDLIEDKISETEYKHPNVQYPKIRRKRNLKFRPLTGKASDTICRWEDLNYANFMCIKTKKGISCDVNCISGERFKVHSPSEALECKMIMDICHPMANKKENEI